jgi:putative flavoprotein involved in K+ transport
MPYTDTVIIGAGHAGLAMSRRLADRGVRHVVLDRGSVGERWRTARWDSFRLLTPNWLSRLPGWQYTGPAPDGFMTAGEFVGYLCDYARSFDAPVSPHTLVTRVEQASCGFVVHTERASWRDASESRSGQFQRRPRSGTGQQCGDGTAWAARCVVIATGYHNRATIPELASGLAPDIAQLTPAGYRSPSSLPDGGVLVVGGSASGVQIAHELVNAGRRVVLAVGSHTRLPRRYRGRDILWWLDRIGSLDRAIDDLPDPAGAMAEPSLQLAGTANGDRLDLDTLRRAGVRLAGRLRAIDGTRAEFADDMGETFGAAQRRLARLLAEIDAYAAATPGMADGPPDPPPAIAVPTGPSTMDLRRPGISTVVWATGFRPWYPWLDVPVLDAGGRIRHCRGVTEVPGLYAIGLRFQHRRNSSFVDGARHDAAYLADQITASRTVGAEVCGGLL